MSSIYIKTPSKIIFVESIELFEAEEDGTPARVVVNREFTFQGDYDRLSKMLDGIAYAIDRHLTIVNVQSYFGL